MILKTITETTSLLVNESYEGETIETKIERIVNNGEPIDDVSPIIYTDRKEGVLPAYDIRTDRWDVAIDAMGKVEKTKMTIRKGYYENNNNDGKPESTETTTTE